MADIEDLSPEQPNKYIRVEAMNRINDSTDYQLNNVVVFSLKLILIGLSGVYLLYEAIELIKLYHNYDTIVSVYYENSDLNQIPSFTICLPSIIDKNKLLVKYPGLRQKLKEAQFDENRNDILTQYLDTAMESLVWTELTVQEVDVLNCTLNYWSIKSNSYAIDSNKQSSGLNCREVVKPIESYSNAKTKCFTYFSQLSADNSFVDWVCSLTHSFLSTDVLRIALLFLGDYSLRYGVKNLNDLYEIIRIELNLDWNRYMTLAFIDNQTTIAIHHQNMIANDESESQLIETGRQYDLTINKISTELLEKPYKTSCFEYSQKNKRIGSRKQCIDNCVIDLYKAKCNCIPIHLTNTLQLLNTTSQTVCSRKDSILRIDDCYEDIAEEVGLCLTTDRCPHECHKIRYSYRMRAKKLMTGSEEMNGNVTDESHTKVLIRIRLDENRGDTFQTHVPLITFGQLLAHICALIALFSGISVIGLTKLLVKTLPTLRVFPTQDKDEDSEQRDGQQIKQRAKQWLTQKSRCSSETPNVINSVGSPNRQFDKVTEFKRPATSTVYDSHIKSNPNIIVKTRHEI